VVRAGIRHFLKSAPSLLVIAEAADGEAACRFIAGHQPDAAVRDAYEGKQVLDPMIRPPSQPSMSALSTRELEELVLAARGCTNKAISAELIISEGPSGAHI